MARFVGTAGKAQKYWEARVVDGALVIDEGAVGTLGKRSVVASPEPARELDRRAKQKLAKGYVRMPDEAPTRASLLATYAPHDVEASDGDPGRARDKALAALAQHGGAAVIAVTHTALRLARRGRDDEARVVLTAVDALAPDADEVQRAVRLAMRGATSLALGDRSAADARLTEALAALAQHADDVWHRTHPSEGVEVADALVDLGRDDEARAVYEAVGFLALDRLLAKGRLAWFDALLPRVAARDAFTREGFALRRAWAEGEAAFVARVREVTEGFPGARTTDESHRGLVALAAAVRAHPVPAHAATLGAALHHAASRAHAATPYLLDLDGCWIALGVAADLGEDISADVDRAVSPHSRAQAVANLLRQCQRDAPRALAATLVPRIIAARTSIPGLHLAGALAAWARGGGRVEADVLREIAATRGTGHLAAGDLAGVALLQGDRALAWELLGAVRKNDLDSAAGVARRSCAAAGDFAAYETLAGAIPPRTEYDRRLEAEIIARHPAG